MSSSGQGSFSHSQKNSPPGGSPPFALNSANSGLHVDIPTGKIQLGSNGVNPLLQNTNIDLAGFQFLVDDAGARQFFINPAGLYQFGDISNANNGNRITVDDINQVYSFRQNANKILDFDLVVGQYDLGDITGIGNNSFFRLSDVNQVALIKVGPGQGLFLNGATLQYQIGDLDGIGNQTVALVDDATASLFIGGLGNAGIKTDKALCQNNPKWNLGDIIVAAAVLDATRYLETTIGGVLVKLAIII